MCSTMNLSFTWAIPGGIVLLLGLISSAIFIITSKDLKNTTSNINLCIVLGFLCLILIFLFPQFSVGAIRYFSLWLCSCSIILLPPDKKQKLLSIFTTGTVAIVTISLPAWILYLLGFPLPHGDTFLYENGFHHLTNYNFFLLNGAPGEQLIPRFTGMFLEPGQLATPCAFLIFANECNFKKIKVVILALAVLFSFSLIGYGILIGGLLLDSFLTARKHRFLIAIFLLLFISVFTILSIQKGNEDNPFYSLIISRLEYSDEKGITGNNRTTAFFDVRYEQMMDSSDKYFGIAKEIDRDNDWTSNTSGVKKFILMYGLVSLCLLSIFFLMLFVNNRCVKSFVFVVVVVVGFFPRSMLLSPYWLFICLTAIPVLKWRTAINLKK